MLLASDAPGLVWVIVVPMAGLLVSGLVGVLLFASLRRKQRSR